MDLVGDIRTTLTSQLSTGNNLLDYVIIIYFIPKITNSIICGITFAVECIAYVFYKFLELLYVEVAIAPHFFIFSYIKTIYFNSAHTDEMRLSGRYQFDLRSNTFNWLESIQLNRHGDQKRHCIITFEGVYLYVSYNGPADSYTQSSTSALDKPPIYIKTWSRGLGQSFWRRFFKHVTEQYNTTLSGKLSITGVNGNKDMQVTKRPLNTIFIDQKIKDLIIKDINMFIDSASRYEKGGLPYRRGYLFYGPPGTGKSSFIKAIASQFNMEICELNPCTIEESELKKALLKVTNKMTIYLFEDIDSAWSLEFGTESILQKGRLDTKPHPANEDAPSQISGRSRMSFSVFLNVLSGVAMEMQGKLFFMTTNYAKVLPPSLIRAGRIEMKVELSYIKSPELDNMIHHLIPDASTEQVKKFAKLASDIPDLTASEVQSYILGKFNIDECINDIDEIRTCMTLPLV